MWIVEYNSSLFLFLFSFLQLMRLMIVDIGDELPVKELRRGELPCHFGRYSKLANIEALAVGPFEDQGGLVPFEEVGNVARFQCQDCGIGGQRYARVEEAAPKDA